MDVERTIEFILKAQAKAEVRMDRMDLRTTEMEKRFDKRINGLTKLMTQGMRMLVKTQANVAELAAAQQKLAESQRELAESQKETERTLKAFINNLRQGRNGGR